MRLGLMWDFVTLYDEIEPKLTQSEKKTNFVKSVEFELGQERLRILQKPAI